MSHPIRSYASALLLLAGCATTQPDRKDSPDLDQGYDQVEPDSQLSVVEAAFVEHVNRFGFDLYGQIAKKAGDGNLAFSPASITTALTMTWAGARGETSQQMSDTLHLPASVDMHRTYAKRLAAWNAPSDDRELAVVNRLFGEKTADFHDPFVKLTGDSYGAPLQPVDFLTGFEAARKEINDWVADQTRDRIRDLLPAGSLDKDTRLVLTNAVYFKATWKHQFDPEATIPRTFSTAGGSSVDAPTMHMRADLAYAKVDGAKVLRLPYADGTMSMDILLPDDPKGIAALEARLSAATVDQWLASTSTQPVDVALPKFKVETPEAIKLKKPLQALGMKLPFERVADFSGMADIHPLYIDDAYHKAFVEVSEEGTEAAAATAVVMTNESAIVSEPQAVEFIADHPFVFLIRDDVGAVLFAGRVADPTA